MSDDVRGDPWWASGSAPADGLAGDEDPLDRHTAARHGTPNGHAGRWWQDAVDALADAARAAGDDADHGRDHDHHHDHLGDAPDDVPPPGGDVCHVCPVCVALRALDRSRPEVVAHLSEAMRHVSLAAKAFIDAQVAATGAADDGLRKVDLDDE